MVSAGLSIELIMYKVLLFADRVAFKPTHRYVELHELLEARRQDVESIVLDEGSQSVDSFLNYMDNSLAHASRRYWMYK